MTSASGTGISRMRSRISDQMTTEFRQPPEHCREEVVISFKPGHELAGRAFEIKRREVRGMQGTKLILQDIADDAGHEIVVDVRDVEQYGQLERPAPSSPVSIAVPVSLECLLAECRAARAA